MILVDTSIWIELLRGQMNLPPGQESLARLAHCPPVVQEIMQGIDYEPGAPRILSGLLAFRSLADPVTLDLYLDAAEIYRKGRQRGITIRSQNDCLIAAIALHYKVPVWHKDRDFDAIARYTMLDVVNPR